MDMKTQFLITAVVGFAITFSSTRARADVSLPLLIISSITASITASNGQVVLNWSGGRPTYQVQTCGNLSGNWSNVGSPTSNSSAIIPMTNGEAFFRVVSDFTAQYQVIFDAM